MMATSSYKSTISKVFLDELGLMMLDSSTTEFRQAEEELPNDTSSSNDEPIFDQEELEEYEAIMRARLPSIPPVDLSWLDTPSSSSVIKAAQKMDGDEDEDLEGEKTMSKAEKQNAKKKRRKDRERAARQAIEDQQREMKTTESEEIPEVVTEQLIPFRLFSTLPVRPISIVHAKEDYPLPINPRHKPLSDNISNRIREVAQLCSSTSEPLPTPATDQRPLTQSSTRSENPIIHLLQYNSTLSTLPNVIHILPATTELPKSARTKSQAHLTLIHKAIRSHDSPTASLKLSHRQRRRLARAQPYHIPAPSFWAPEFGLGGKAAGYAYGYRGSQEGQRESGWGYIRS